MEDFRNSFEKDSQDLLVLDTKEIAASPGAVDAVRRAHSGSGAVWQLSENAYWRERNPIGDAIHRNKLKIFSHHVSKPQENASRKCNPSRITWSRGPALIFTLGARTGVENWEFRRILPNQVCPLLYRMAMACQEWSSEVPPTSWIVLDGAVIIQFMKPATAKKLQWVCTAGLCALDIFWKLHHATWLDLVRDRYITDSLKGTARAKRGKGMRRRVLSSGTEPTSS